MSKLLTLLLVIGTPLQAGEYRLLEADRLDVEYTRLNPNNRDPYAPEYTGLWKERAALKWDISVLNGSAYWRNNVHTETVQSGTVKTVGWEWEAGIPLLGMFELFYHHHSRHIMDQEATGQTGYPESKNTTFPVEDGIGIRIKFINR